VSLLKALWRVTRILLLWTPVLILLATMAIGKLRELWHPAIGWWLSAIFIASVVVGCAWYLIKPKSTTHGSAAFATAMELYRSRLLGRRGLIIGRRLFRYLRFDRDGHLLTFAPTRSGKGVSCVIPNLLDHAGSVVVTDIKGENLAVTGLWRKNIAPVHAIAPFDASIAGSRYNPLDFIRAGMPEDVDDAALIADLLVVPQGQETFWDSEAQSFISTLLLYVVSELPADKRNLHHVWTLLMQDKDGLDRLVKEMRASEHDAVRRAGNAFSQKEERERSAVISTCQTHMKIWKSALLARATSQSDFQLEDLKRTVMSLYVVVPPELLEVYRPFVRLMVGLSVSAMTRVKPRPAERVLFLLDEVAALGRMAPIETGIAYLAGYGVSIWLFFQDLGQLQATYPKWRSMVANCNVRQAFGVADVQTARELSAMLGNRTIRLESQGSSQSLPIAVVADSFSRHVNDAGRALMTPDEVMKMPQHLQLIFVQACPPIRATKVQYWRERLFRGRFGRAN
jgi:type IV secretion system protein VirD4